MSEFIYHHHPATRAQEPRSLLLLHGTGGSEHDLLPLAEELAPGVAVLSPRGQISENGAARFFRRFAEGVLDIEDWRARTHQLADFLVAKDRELGLQAEHRVAIGFSNGANIALGLLLLRPEVLHSVVLMRPMFVSEEPGPPLDDKSVLVLSGQYDPLVNASNRQALLDQLSERKARVTAHLVDSGHSLTPNDLALAKTFIDQ